MIYLGVAFPYKEAITNAYGLIMVTRNNIVWKLWPNRSHSNTPGQPVTSYVLQEKAKGQWSMLYGKASVWDSSFRNRLQSNSWESCRMEIMWKRTRKQEKLWGTALHNIKPSSYHDTGLHTSLYIKFKHPSTR